MNSRDYWLQREAEQLKHNITEEAEYDRELKRIYQNMLDNCQKEIDSFYGKYAAAEGITIAEAKRRVSKHDVKAFERTAARYVKERNFSKQANEELRLYNATMKINRLEMLKANIGLELIAGHDELEKFMGGVLKGRTEAELKRQAGILGKTIKNNAQLANAIVNGSFHNGTFSDRIWQYQDIMRQDLGKLLQQGLIQGKGARAIAKDLKKYWYGNDPRTGGGAKYCMERLMRTELARVQTEAQKQSFERNGFDMYQFICNVNPTKHGTCPVCRRLANQDKGLGKGVYLVADMMPGTNAPPMHPHCRCSTAAYSDDEEYEAWLDFLDSGGTTAEWNKQREKLAAEKMAYDEEAKNDWSKTEPRKLTKTESRELIKYAAENDVAIRSLKEFDGDPDMLKSAIETLGKTIKQFPTGRKVSVSFSHSKDDGEFASTIGEHITFNAKAFRNRAITEQNIASGGMFASTKFEDFVAHEYGHVISFVKGNKGLEISGKAFYNVFGKTLSTSELLDYLDENISVYSTTISKRKYTEIVPEVLAKNNSKPNDFTEEFVVLLKGAYFNEED